MDFLEDAKRHYEALVSSIHGKAYVSSIRSSLNSLIKLEGKLEALCNRFFDETTIEDEALPNSVSAKDFYLAEDCALSIADYLISFLTLREFDQAVALENIRQELFALMLNKDEKTRKAFYASNEEALPRHTPLGW